MSRRTLALLATFGASTIYGLTHTVAKGVMPTYVSPSGFIFLRLLGATLLFWGVSHFGPKEKIHKKDWGRMLLCAFLGMSINMFAFLKGLQLSTPINSAVLVTITPIIVIILSAFFLKERITFSKGFGILLGFVAALTLVLFGAEIRQDAPNIPLGNLFFVMNSVAYGSYLVAAKSLLQRYHPFTVMHWLFLIGMIISLPFTLPDFLDTEWTNMPLWAYGAIGFVIVGTTFFTYLFNMFAMTQLKASTIGAFIYLQPVIGIVFALLTGKDSLNWVKITAALFALIGVYLASLPTDKKPKLFSSKSSQ